MSSVPLLFSPSKNEPIGPAYLPLGGSPYVLLTAGESRLGVFRQKARYYINLSLYVGSLLTTSFLALGVAVFLGLIGKVKQQRVSS